MNVISYNIVLRKKRKIREPIAEVLDKLIADNFSFDGSMKDSVEDFWNTLPHENLKSINSSNFLLASFEVEGVKTYLFKNTSLKIQSNSELTVTVFGISEKEINLIIKSTFLKVKKLFFQKTIVKIIEGTFTNIYPFDTDNNDIINPQFFLKANFKKEGVELETRDWIKLAIFTVVTVVFIVMYFITPDEVVNPTSNAKVANNVKEVFSAIMSVGISVVVLEVIVNILIPLAFRSKFPKVVINNFSNIIENKVPKVFEEKKRLKDPED